MRCLLEDARSSRRRPDAGVPTYYTLYLLLDLRPVRHRADQRRLQPLCPDLEICSLTSYALIAMGNRRADTGCELQLRDHGRRSARRFTCSASDTLYIKTGTRSTWSRHSAAVIACATNYTASPTVHVAFVLIMLGVWIKDGLLPATRLVAERLLVRADDDMVP